LKNLAPNRTSTKKKEPSIHFVRDFNSNKLDCLHITYLLKGYLVKGFTTCKRTTKIISAISLYFKWMKVRITILRNLKFEVVKEKQLSQIQPGYWVALAAGDCVPNYFKAESN